MRTNPDLSHDAGTKSSGPGRLHRYTPGELSDEQRAVYVAITAGPRGSRPRVIPLVDKDGCLEGPFNAMLVNPSVGDPLQALGASLRYSTSLTHRQREAAILTLAAARRCDFEWLAHEAVGRANGLSNDELVAIKMGKRAETFDDSEAAVLNVVRSLISHRDLDDELFASAGSLLGVATIVELVFIVGYYDTLALSLHTFRTPLPSGQSPVW